MHKTLLTRGLPGLLFGFGLCWILAQHVTLTRAEAAVLLRDINGWALLGALLVSLLMIEAGARKWACLDEALDGHQRRPHRYYLRHFIWQNWLAQLLPSTVALIAGRAAVTHATEAKNWRRGLRSGFVDQLSELFVILAFIPATLWQLHTGGGFLGWLLLGLAATLAGGALGQRLWPRYVLPRVLAWSFIRIALITLRLVLGVLAFGLPIAPAIVAYATPLATLTVLLPLTPGNLGLAEWGWTYALTLWRTDPTVGALYALSFRLLVFSLQSLLLLALPALRAR